MNKQLILIISLLLINCQILAGQTPHFWTRKADVGFNLPAGPPLQTFTTGFSIGTKGYITTGEGYSSRFASCWEYDSVMNVWSQKADLPGGGRSYATAFSIGNKGYLGTGYTTTYENSFYEFDPAANTWTAKAPFAGGARIGAVSLSINGKGYLGTGYNGTTHLNDFWEYNPTTDTWTQKAAFGGAGRAYAVALNINNKGYIGTGATSQANPVTFYNDFWEYNPATDTWAQKASLTSLGRQGAIGFTSGTKGYVGTGERYIAAKDFWEYDPATNLWVQKTDFPSNRAFASSFMIGDKGYAAGGNSNELWQYNSTSNTWNKKADFGGLVKTKAAGFSIGNKGYIATGNYSKELWEYDPATGVWTQKADFGGTGRSDAVAFTIGTKAYLGTGWSTATTASTNDFWEYNPATNAWTQKAPFAGLPRYDAIGFSIGGKGYLGTGTTTAGLASRDFWEYDPVTDVWTRKADYIVSKRMAVGFSIADKGYVGTGIDSQTNYNNHFYRYDPAANTWTQIASVGYVRERAFAFSMAGKGYMGTGGAAPGYYNDFWEYNPSTNTWSSQPNVPIARQNASAFSIGNRGYVGLGENNNSEVMSDFWEFTPNIQTTTPAGSPFCAGSPITVNFTYPDTFNTGNTFTIELSTVQDNFTNPITLGTMSGTLPGPVACTLPASTPASNFYQVRVRSSSPALNGEPGANLIAVTAPAVPAVSIATPATSVCPGTAITFTASATNGGTAPAYQWKVNGVNAGTGVNTYTYTPANGDVVSCVLTTSLTCVSAPTAISNALTITVSATQVPAVSITASGTTVCSGTNVVFSATPVNGGFAPSYQWKVNGVNAGTNSATYAFAPANGNVITCTITSSLSCASPATATSNGVTMTVNPNVTLSATISTPATTVCAGTPVTFTSNILNGGAAPVLDWIVNSSLVSGANGSTYTFTPTAAITTVRLNVTGSNACTTPTAVVSSTVTITRTTPAAPSVTIASANNVCAGTAVTFTATPFNGGAAPAYQWKVNGVNTGTDSSTFAYTPVNGDVITCVLTSNSTCATTQTHTSSGITMVVNPTVTPSVSITTGTTILCSGATATYYATSVNGGSNPVYQWRVNNVNTGSLNSTVFNYTPQNGDVVTCILSSNGTCVAPATATSNALAMIVNANLTTAVTINASTGPLCAGNSVTVSATPVNGGLPAYQWKVNNINAGPNAGNFTYVPANGDVVTCYMTGSLGCSSPAGALSNALTMNVAPAVTASVFIASATGISLCAGTAATYTASPVNGGTAPAYQWYVNSVAAGSGGNTYTYTPANGDAVSCSLSSNALCLVNGTTGSNVLAMAMSPFTTPALLVSAPAAMVCAGAPLTFTAAAANGGPAPLYQWQVNNIASGNGGNTFSYAPANGDTVSCILTSNATCVTTNIVAGNKLPVTVTPRLTPSITISASNNTVCAGVPVNFTAAVSNGGVSPAFLWRRNGLPAGTNSNLYSYTPQNGDLIACRAISDASCPDSALSAETVMTVHSLPIPVITYNGSALSTGIANAVYQWYYDGAALPGATGMTYAPAHDGRYTVHVTDVNGCAATSAVFILNALTVDNTGTRPVLPRFYPNPAAVQIYIDYPETVSVSVFSLDGKLLLYNAGTKQMDISGLKDGVYMIRLVTKTQRVVTARLVKIAD